VDLLGKLVAMDPSERFAADACLDHAYLKPIRGDGELLPPPGALDSVDPGLSLGLPQIRGLIRDHARRFRQVAEDVEPAAKKRRT
jgi:hypothetical protein